VASPPGSTTPLNNLIGRNTNHIQVPTINIVEASTAADHPIWKLDLLQHRLHSGAHHHIVEALTAADSTALPLASEPPDQFPKVLAYTISIM
jgi:hypothetical protein